MTAGDRGWEAGEGVSEETNELKDEDSEEDEDAVGVHETSIANVAERREFGGDDLGRS